MIPGWIPELPQFTCFCPVYSFQFCPFYSFNFRHPVSRLAFKVFVFSLVKLKSKVVCRKRLLKTKYFQNQFLKTVQQNHLILSLNVVHVAHFYSLQPTGNKLPNKTKVRLFFSVLVTYSVHLVSLAIPIYQKPTSSRELVIIKMSYFT